MPLTGGITLADVIAYYNDSDDAAYGGSDYESCIIIGTGASVDANTSGGLVSRDMIAIGTNASAVNHGSIALGDGAIAGDTGNGDHEDCIAIGTNAQALDRHSTAIGHDAYAGQLNATAIGDDTKANSVKCTAVGNAASAGNTNAGSDRNVSIGDIAKCNSTTVGGFEKSTAIGYDAEVDGASNAVAIGATSQVTHDNSIAIGVGATSDAEDQVNFGTSNVVTGGGVRRQTSRYTTTQTLGATDHHVFCDTDGGAWTLSLPAGVDGQEYRIINTGSSRNNLTIAPNGAELLTGANSSRTLSDGGVIILVYETTEGWW